MPYIACGINHKSAAIAVREQAFFAPQELPVALQDLIRQGAANEAMILSTCNRTEFYAHSADPQQLSHWLGQSPMGQNIPSAHWYWRQDDQAVSHIMRVACGLDSMILGEPQILGQMKHAFSLAKEVGTIGSQLHRLLQRVFSVTKQVRTTTGIGASPISIAYAAVTLAKRIFTHLAKRQVLLVGSGQTMQLVALHLWDLGVRRIIVANRSLQRAQVLANEFQGLAISLAEIPLYLQQADVVITATGSTLPIIGKGMVERALKTGKRRPIFMVDLGLPRTVEPEVAELEDVYLYNLDDLETMVAETIKSRTEEARCADEIITLQAQYFMRQLKALNAVDTIRDFRKKMNQLRHDELSKALNLLNRGSDPAILLQEMSQSLLNKIMHFPTVHMHQAGFDGQLELILAARKLFEL